MTARDDLDRRLAAWFAADAPVREPEHLLGQVLARTAHTRRRPARRVPERWIPMDTLTTRTAAAPRLPWRLVGLAALLILALVAGAAFIAAQPRTRVLPAPFGPAANGLVLYSADGDIYSVDTATGARQTVIAGATVDLDPTWSLDGTRFAFRRQQPDGDVLYVAHADGSDVMPITSEPKPRIDSISFSPDGGQLLFSYATGGGRIAIAKADGSETRTLDLGMPALMPTFRPPDGAEIAFIGAPTSDLKVEGVYVVNADGTGLRTLVEPSISNTAELPRWSPDGALLAYDAADFTVQAWTVQTHVVRPDGGGDRTLPAPADALWSGAPAWSNDGTRLAMVRGYSVYNADDVVIAVVPADGSGPGVMTERSLLSGWPSGISWAPDDTAILVKLEGSRTPLLVDPATGGARAAAWTTNSVPGWQRLAP